MRTMLTALLAAAARTALKPLSAGADPLPVLESAREPRPILPDPRLRLALGARLHAWLEREALLVAVCATYVVLWVLALPYAVEGDTWLALVGGREIAQHGIPQHDTLAALTHGREWVDQQWLAQLAFYALERIGGLGLIAFVVVLLCLGPLAIALTLARRRGGSPARIVPFAILPALAFWSFARVQVFSQLLFVLLLGLLAAESRRPSRRVLLAFPLLGLWANLHGAVVVGATLVALLGGSELVAAARGTKAGARAWGRGLALTTLPWLCIFASPYGFSLAPYYRATLGNPLFREFLAEWTPPTLPTPLGGAFFVLAAAAVVLVARRPRELTLFEHAALWFTLAGGLLAIRSILWFAYACIVFLPPLLGSGHRPARAAPPRPTLLLAVATSALAVAVAIGAAVRPGQWLTRAWPDEAAAAVTRAAANDPNAKILTDGGVGDWLLYERPSLRGRIAFDGRWELLPRAQMRTTFLYLWQIGAGWERVSRGYRLLVLSPQSESRLVETYDRRGLRVLYRDRNIVVYDRVEHRSR